MTIQVFRTVPANCLEREQKGGREKTEHFVSLSGTVIHIPDPLLQSGTKWLIHGGRGGEGPFAWQHSVSPHRDTRVLRASGLRASHEKPFLAGDMHLVKWSHRREEDRAATLEMQLCQLSSQAWPGLLCGNSAVG